jgi:hypothetical protein
MSARFDPQSGDVIVREAHHDGKSRYLLSTVGFASQIFIVDYEQAKRHALAYAESQNARAWVAVNDTDPVLLTRSRS